ncbi:TRAP-type C4-dicarboxylate transport system permease small subunit [Paracoccus versutus]|uniref:TRAP transporter small permease protein n=1 Tax=Paracoccus versutus TaxID=34007 RepID=A0A3D9XGL1_PARVE|nr:TRAP-type C4-dicarboxylate transport system permease small subunit [Paracoccus versutus]
MGNVLSWLERLSLSLAVLSVTLIMFIVSYDAFSRYALHAPLPWAYELITYYLMLAGTYFAVSATFTAGDHINIDLFRHLIAPRLRARLDALWSLLGVVIFGIVAYGSWSEMAHAYSRNEFLPGYITWPAWMSYLPIVLGFALLVVRMALHAALLIVHGRDPHVIEHGNELEEHHE